MMAQVSAFFFFFLTEDAVMVLASHLLFYFLFKQSKSDLVLRPCSSVALSYKYLLVLHSELSLLAPKCEQFGLSGCLFVTNLRPAVLPHARSGTSLGMKGLSPGQSCGSGHCLVFIARHSVLPCNGSCWEYMVFPDWGCRKRAQKAVLCT